jgi:hypothetical protein
MALIRRSLLGGLLLFGVPDVLQGQASGAAIRDNSFLVEEAYNQDRNVVQHIGTFTSSRNGAWAANVTDEWPLGGVRNQVSVGLTLGEAGLGTQYGTLALNYRRQVFGAPDAAVIVSPRLSLLASLGSSSDRVPGLQANVPVTAVLSESFVSHWNLGATIGTGPTILNVGASVVWLTLPWMNFLVEGVFLGAAGQPPTYIVSPAVRWALNFGAVQVVPGVAIPLHFARSGENAVLLYLSIEHPFGPTDTQ